MWYGENRSGRQVPWQIGDIVRYDNGPSALMKIESVSTLGPEDDIAKRVRYYGTQFYGGACGASHGKCLHPSQEDFAFWRRCHDEKDVWIRGAWS